MNSSDLRALADAHDQYLNARHWIDAHKLHNPGTVTVRWNNAASCLGYSAVTEEVARIVAERFEELCDEAQKRLYARWLEKKSVVVDALKTP